MESFLGVIAAPSEVKGFTFEEQSHPTLSILIHRVVVDVVSSLLFSSLKELLLSKR